MNPITLTHPEIRDIITAIGGKLPAKRVLGEGFTGRERLALRAKLEAAIETKEEVK